MMLIGDAAHKVNYELQTPQTPTKTTFISVWGIGDKITENDHNKTKLKGFETEITQSQYIIIVGVGRSFQLIFISMNA
jgi:hypothetical protein